MEDATTQNIADQMPAIYLDLKNMQYERDDEWGDVVHHTDGAGGNDDDDDDDNGDDDNDDDVDDDNDEDKQKKKKRLTLKWSDAFHQGSITFDDDYKEVEDDTIHINTSIYIHFAMTNLNRANPTMQRTFLEQALERHQGTTVLCDVTRLVLDPVVYFHGL